MSEVQEPPVFAMQAPITVLVSGTHLNVTSYARMQRRQQNILVTKHEL